MTRLAARRRWAAACEAGSRVPAGRFTPGAILALAEAAANAGSLPAARKAAEAAIPAALPHGVRARVARLVLLAGAPFEAWLVLSADPTLFTAPEASDPLATTLVAFARSDEPLLRMAAQAVGQACLGPSERPGRGRRAVPLAPGGPPPPRRRPIEIRASSAAGAEAVAEFRALADALEEEAARGAPGPAQTLVEDVFVNANGQVWRPDGRQVWQGLAPGLRRPVPAEDLAAMARAPEIAEGELAARGSDRNFYHWCLNRLFALGAAADRPDGPPPLLVGPGAPAFISESLAAAQGGRPWPMRVVDPVLRVRRLTLSSQPVLAIGNRAACARMLDPIVALAESEPPPAGSSGPLLYLSRRDSRRRPLRNEAEFEQRLAELGFVPVCFGGRGFLEQVRIVRAARLIVSPHGAGLAHLAFARPGITVVELMPAVIYAGARFNMARISRAVGHRHVLWLEPAEPVGQSWSLRIEEVLPLIVRLAGDPDAPLT
ncbi:MAG: glycosyltransferase family 61 protein [Acetobacteraceae bacterium]|nr:glycosyltransferase family 61 protein [Acetobacteraceae bacterium]